MLEMWQRRVLRRQARDVLQHARHVLHMREDLLAADVRERVVHLQDQLDQSLKRREYERVAEWSESLSSAVAALPGQKVRGGWKENFEMLVVAVVVAMGLRAYFLQPFKIPTGSMQPTLHGITAQTVDADWSDRLPFKVVRFLITGEWHSVIRARAGGTLGEGMAHAHDPSIVLFRIGGVMHRIPKDILTDAAGELRPAFHPERQVQAGEVLWAGRTQRGDHLFVNKVIWNFRKPRRDEVMVFTTSDIPTLEPGTHYIKRLVGLPGERMAIHEPFLVANGSRLGGFLGIDRVTSGGGEYAGYLLAGHLNSPNLEWRLNDDQYFALGDNTRNSRDSRYWGPVPQENLVGPAVWVYWPVTRRWGLIR